MNIFLHVWVPYTVQDVIYTQCSDLLYNGIFYNESGLVEYNSIRPITPKLTGHTLVTLWIAIDEVAIHSTDSRVYLYISMLQFLCDVCMQ